MLPLFAVAGEHGLVPRSDFQITGDPPVQLSQLRKASMQGMGEALYMISY